MRNTIYYKKIHSDLCSGCVLLMYCEVCIMHYDGQFFFITMQPPHVQIPPPPPPPPLPPSPIVTIFPPFGGCTRDVHHFSRLMLVFFSLFTEYWCLLLSKKNMKKQLLAHQLHVIFILCFLFLYLFVFRLFPIFFFCSTFSFHS